MAASARRSHTLFAGISMLALAACGETFSDFDIDMRGSGGSAADTSEAARNQTAARPAPDSRGVISYPNYQVAVANRGDTVVTVADRVGLPAAELARFNGLPLDAPLSGGEIIALPTRVAEPSTATGAITSGPITPGSVDITTLAGSAIDRADGTPRATSTLSSGEEPTRHQVQAGETAFIIARQYNVSVEALADWNGLGDDYAVRNGQWLLIPVVIGAPMPQATSAPGTGSVTPEPPSAATPLPAVSPGPAPAPTPPPPALEETRTAASNTAQFQMPVSGSIVRDYDADDFTGIGISAERRRAGFGSRRRRGHADHPGHEPERDPGDPPPGRSADGLFGHRRHHGRARRQRHARPEGGRGQGGRPRVAVLPGAARQRHLRPAALSPVGLHRQQGLSRRSGHRFGPQGR